MIKNACNFDKNTNNDKSDDFDNVNIRQITVRMKINKSKAQLTGYMNAQRSIHFEK